MKEITALHSGDIGDVIYAIPTMKALNVEKIILNTRPDYGTKMDEKACKVLKPLLIHQGFKVEISDKYYSNNVDFYIDDFRLGNPDLTYTHLGHAQAKAMDVVIDWEKKFLNVNFALPVADIVINRSPRYHNPGFDWYELLHDIKQSIIFIGLKSEYDQFLRHTKIRNVKYYPTNDLWQCAQLIAGCKVYIGNQSCNYAIAEGLKVNRIQETDPKVPNCTGQSDNSVDVVDYHDLLVAKQKINDWLGINSIVDLNVPDKVMLYTTAYVGSQDGVDRMNRWLDYYHTKNAQKLGATRIVVIDDGSPVGWLKKLDLYDEIVFHDVQTGDKRINIPADINHSKNDGKIIWLHFVYNLGRPHIHLFPGWWRSYSFGGAVATVCNFDKFIFTESDSFVFSDNLFDYIKNRNNEWGSLWDSLNGYRETCVQWCNRDNFFKIVKNF